MSLWALVAGWAIFSTITDSLSKTLLHSFPFPITLTLTQFFLSAVAGYFILLVLRIRPFQHAYRTIGVASALPLSAAQTLGFVLTNISFGLVAVSFTQTVKVPSIP